jgi:hypothetical protein
LADIESTAGGESLEADVYEVLQDHDVDDAPPAHRPVGPGDVFCDIALDHLAVPFVGPVMVVGHPCSLRRGLILQDDIPVAPVAPAGVPPTAQHPHADRVLPVRRLIPPGGDQNRVVQLTRTTTVAAERLSVSGRCASLNGAGVVALQQRLVGNQTRVKVPPGVIAAHCRGPLTELELWSDWRERCVEAGKDADAYDTEFEAFMTSDSGFAGLAWREALAQHEHARARALAAMETVLDALVG